jgi:hypothetical protein
MNKQFHIIKDTGTNKIFFLIISLTNYLIYVNDCLKIAYIKFAILSQLRLDIKEGIDSKVGNLLSIKAFFKRFS